MLAAGALDVSRYVFFITLFATRIVRFGLEALLAVSFGKRILVWLESDLVQNVIAGLIVIAVLLTIIGLVKIVARLARHRAARRPEAKSNTASSTPGGTAEPARHLMHAVPECDQLETC